MRTPWRWAHSNELLDERRMVCYDSEFVREKSYYPKLALVQWQVCGEREAVLCDPIETNPPWQTLLAHEAPFIMHSGSQDLELIRQESGALPKAIRDTQVGFALCHPNQAVSFAEMVNHYLDIEIDKSATRSDWLKRPLATEQLDYAANDVGLLARVYPLLCAELNRLGRMSWWAEECRHLLESQQNPKAVQAWYKLRNAPQLQGRETAVAALLHHVRECIAREHDWPRKKVLDDKIIITIAKSGITQPDELAEYLDSDHLLFTKQAELDEGFANIDTLPYPTIPRPPRLSDKAREYYKQLSARCTEAATALNIHSDVLSTNKNLRYFAAGQANDCRITQGWRRPFFADLI